MSKTIKYAGIAGIVSLILAVPITFFEILKSLNKLEDGFVWLYIFVLFLSLVLYILFLWGFKLVSEKYQNNLLRISSYLWIVSAIIYYGYLISTLISPNMENSVVDILAVVIFGVVAIPFGISLLKLEPVFGSIATGAGVIAIITGISLASVILVLLGLLMLIPLYILTSMILFRAAKKIETTPAI